MWYACLEYNNAEILIPQESIEQSSFAPNREESDFSLSECLGSAYEQKNTGMAVTRLKIAGEPPLTVWSPNVPHLEDIKDEDFIVFEGRIGSALRRKGLISCRFDGEKIQYLADIRRLEESWKKKKYCFYNND